MTDMFVFADDTIRVITKTDNTTTGKGFSHIDIYEIEGTDPNNVHSHFGFSIIDLSSQGRQGY